MWQVTGLYDEVENDVKHNWWAHGVVDRALVSQLWDTCSNPSSTKKFLSEKWLSLGPYNTSFEMHYSFGSMYLHFSLVIY